MAGFWFDATEELERAAAGFVPQIYASTGTLGEGNSNAVRGLKTVLPILNLRAVRSKCVCLRWTDAVQETRCLTGLCCLLKGVGELDQSGFTPGAAEE